MLDKCDCQSVRFGAVWHVCADKGDDLNTVVIAVEWDWDVLSFDQGSEGKEGCNGSTK